MSTQGQVGLAAGMPNILSQTFLEPRSGWSDCWDAKHFELDLMSTQGQVGLAAGMPNILS